MIKQKTQAFICVLVGAFIALTTHIWISEWLKPILDKMIRNAAEHNINSYTDPSTYPPIIIYAAYITAIMTTGFLVFCYYHAQTLIPGRSKPIKALYAIAILFGLKSDLIRQPIMDFILNYTIGFDKPILFVIFNHIDKWLANLFLAISIVYLCPKKHTE